MAFDVVPSFTNRNIYTVPPETFSGMRRAVLILCVFLLLASFPAGALALAPSWRSPAPSDITALSLSADGSYILTGGERVCLYSGDGTPLWQEWTAELVACSADGSRIACVDGQSLFLLTREGTAIWREEMPSPAVCLAFPGRIVVADRFGKVYFYDADGSLRATADTRGDPGDDGAIRSDIRAISSCGEYTAVISTRGLFYYRDAGRKVWTHDEMTDGGTAVAVSGPGKDIVAGSDAGIRFLDNKGNLVWSQKLRRPVTALAISGDGSRVVVGSQDNTVRCFDREGEEVWVFETDGWIRDVAVSGDGSRVLAGSMDRQAYLLDGTGGLIGTCNLDGWVDHVALSADGTAGIAASLREVIGIPMETPTPVETPAPMETPAPVETPGETPTIEETPVPAEEPVSGWGPGPYALILGLFACGAVFGVGYLRRERSAPAREELVIASPTPLEEEEIIEPHPWKPALEQGDLRGAARALSGQMITLIRERTGVRIVTTADALTAYPGQKEALAGFFEDADRLAYARAEPEMEEVLALEVEFFRLAGEMTPLR